MKNKTLHSWIGMTAIALALLVGSVSTAPANGRDIVVSGHAGVSVWVDGGDVFPDYRDVSIYLRADRDCYATLLLVDTAGYLHVLYPSTPRANAWFYGGRTYRYDAYDLGLDRLDGVGIAHLYAVASPVPFDYSYYGASVFVGGFGFRVYGDPYVACRDFYVSLLPASCRWDFVAVSSARFYVRQWVRYPAYLCSPGYGLHVRVGDSCRECSHVYASYRCNVTNPRDVFRAAPVSPPKFKTIHASTRAASPARHATQARAAKSGERYSGRSAARPAVERDEARVARAERARVVSTSRSREAARASVKAPHSQQSQQSRKSAVSARADARGERVARGEAAAPAKKNVAAKSKGGSAGKSAAASRQKGAAKQGRQAQ